MGTMELKLKETIYLKDGVEGPITNEMMQIAGTINRIWEHVLNKNLIITSMRDGIHMKNSKHYEGKAIDIRNKDLTIDEKNKITSILKLVFKECDVIEEKDHIHVELKK